MQKSKSGKLFSASDLVNFAARPHLTHLDPFKLETPLPQAVYTDEMALIQGKGFKHEGRYLEVLRSQHCDVADLKEVGISDAVAFAKTRNALGPHAGRRAAYQLEAAFPDAPLQQVRVGTVDLSDLSKLASQLSEILRNGDAA